MRPAPFVASRARPARRSPSLRAGTEVTTVAPVTTRRARGPAIVGEGDKRGGGWVYELVSHGNDKIDKGGDKIDGGGEP